jgi:NitT/TauT family transport system substrate-binding protein
MVRRTRIVAGLGLLGVIIGVLGVWRYAASRRPHPQPFNIAFNEWVGFAPFFVAKDLGYFGNLPVDFDFIAVEGDKRAGLYAGRFQMICETLDMFETSRESQDFPGKIIFAIDESFGGDGVIAVKEVQTLKDLRGANVVAEPGQPSYFILQYLLHKEGMTLRDIKVQSMNSSDAAAAFIAKKADVAGTYEPYLTQALQKRPGSHLLVSSTDLPGYIVDVAIVRAETLNSRREDLVAILRGWCMAVEQFKIHRSESVANMAKAFKITPDEFTRTVEGLRYFDCSRGQTFMGTGAANGPIFEIFKNVGTILNENNLTSVTVSAQDRIDPSVVQAVAASEGNR